MMKNFLKYGFITLGVLLLLAGLVWGSGYLWSYRLTELAEIPGAATLVPEGEVELRLLSALPRAYPRAATAVFWCWQP